MQVVSLLGFVDYEGSELLGVFESVEQCLQWVQQERESGQYGVRRQESLGYDDLGYVVSELGQRVPDVLSCVEYL